MTSEHDLPWSNGLEGEIFRKASTDLKNSFKFNRATIETYPKNLDELLWRHWIVSYSIRYAIKFANTSEFNFAECGAADGVSTFFALREIVGQKQLKENFSMHLYDAWDAMRRDDLLDSELPNVNRYAGSNIDIIKENLSEFSKWLVYHQGYIPESFTTPPESPQTIVYGHIDLNSAKPTLAALEFFYPRLVSGGVILFDDYGWEGYEDTKIMIDKFFHNKTGIVQKLPTGQAIYYHK